MAKNQPMEKKKKHFIAVTTSIILTILIILLIIVLAVTLTLPTGYKLVFNVDGQVTTSLEVKAKDEVVLADPAPKDGYTFGGWYFDNDKFAEPCTPETLKDKKLKGENTIYAKWIKNDYTITYNLNGGENAKGNPSGYVVDTATIKLAAPTKLGYTFGGWYGKADFSDKAITEITKGSTGNKELFAKWNKDTYTITYNLDGGAEVTANPTTYAIDTATITLNAPTKLGYTFGGWYSEDTFATKVTEIASGSTGNKTLFAKWTAIEYGITYNLKEGVLTGTYPTTYTTDKDTTLAMPTRAYYTFDGWCEKSDLTDTPIKAIAKGTISDKTFYAKWTPTTYTMKFNSNGGGTIADITINIEGSLQTRFDVPSKTGYAFGGWYDNATFDGNAITAPNGSIISFDFTVYLRDMTLYAKWTAIEYGITYNLNGGALAEPYPKTYTIATPTITLATPTKSGYTFGGWYGKADFSDKAITEIAIGSTEKKTFYAKLTKDTYTITYNLNGGVEGTANPTTYAVDTATITLNDPTKGKNWMLFDGWYTAATDGTKVEKILLGSTGNLTLYAHWSFTGTPGLTYTLSSDSQSYEVSKGTATDVEIGIPSKHEEGGKALPVNIAANGFGAMGITSLVIDEGVTSIGEWAFSRCEALISVTIPDSVKSMEQAAFRNCISLTSVTIPSGVTSIVTDTFNGCKALTSIVIPKGVKSIGKFAFSGCFNLERVNIQNGVKSIGELAFGNCTALKSVVIPESVTTVGTDTFYDCTNLTSVYIPSSVTTIGSYAFQGCTALTISCEIARANVPVPNDPHTTGWHASWMGNVPAGNIKWSQPAPKLVP